MSRPPPGSPAAGGTAGLQDGLLFVLGAAAILAGAGSSHLPQAPHQTPLTPDGPRARFRGSGRRAARRALTAGLHLTITFVASEALAVVTVMPVVARDLGGLRLYGWVFSGFMLGSVVGIVAAGRKADGRGPAVPFVAGVVLFGSGLAVAGLAPSMSVLVAGRVLQGLGAGAVPSVAYVTIGRSLPETLRARMMAVLSTAWVAPGVAGPAISAEVARLFGGGGCSWGCCRWSRWPG